MGGRNLLGPIRHSNGWREGLNASSELEQPSWRRNEIRGNVKKERRPTPRGGGKNYRVARKKKFSRQASQEQTAASEGRQGGKQDRVNGEVFARPEEK